MLLTVRHVTHYWFSKAPDYVVQRLHLEPAAFAGQKILRWEIKTPGIEKALRYVDAFGNCVHLVTYEPDSDSVDIIAEGQVETTDTAGVVRGLSCEVPDAVFLRQTPPTTCDAAMKHQLADMALAGSVLEKSHQLMQFVHRHITYEVGNTDNQTSAAQAFAGGRGVCQDYAHVMIALARHLAIPARYVTGYLVTGVGASAAAAHAWAELAVPDLGWVGFDATNGQCPTEHYVRVAAGLDALGVTPILGSRRGGPGEEQMSVEVQVEVSQQ
jgi:transglutaminase-like putative cysteine protease